MLLPVFESIYFNQYNVLLTLMGTYQFGTGL